MSAFYRDLFPNLTLKDEVGGDIEEIELTLGLSMNGQFGVDPAEKKKLARSSSIPDFLNPSMEPLPPPSALLVRTCSLPVQTEEELRKRKEIQSLRRLEAKMKRTAKQRISKGDGQDLQNIQIPNWVSPQPQALLQQQGSVGSQRSGSSGISESDSLKLQGFMKTDGPIITACNVKCEETPSECGKSMLENMPCVSTKGVGPNGKRIEGFLYRYSKREEVRIVCVCHGSFLSPLEFVQHAGGGDVVHPLRHIVVNHSPLL